MIEYYDGIYISRKFYKDKLLSRQDSTMTQQTAGHIITSDHKIATQYNPLFGPY